jgi:hypothetical protein
MIWNLIGSIGGKVLDIVDDVVEDKDEANRLKFEIQRQLIENKSSELEASAKIVLAEAQGSWLQRNWRPLLMVTFTGLIVAHWFGLTAPNIPESVQNSLLNIVMVGVWAAMWLDAAVKRLLINLKDLIDEAQNTQPTALHKHSNRQLSFFSKL